MSLRKTRRSPEKPKVLNSYSIVQDSVGSGSFGFVSKAQTKDGHYVAIKRVLIEHDDFKSNEYELLEKINHPNCINPIDHFYSRDIKKNEIYENIVMEFIDINLYKLINTYKFQSKQIPILWIKYYSIQLLLGLQYLHKQNIIHRDVKPENLLIDTQTNILKICDFGCACFLEKGKKQVTYVASRNYRAPELLLDCPYYTGAVDIWAAGCVIAEMLSGHMLFNGNSGAELFEDIERIIGNPTFADFYQVHHGIAISSVKESPKGLAAVLPDKTPPDLLDLLRRILVYNPNKRPTASQLLRHKFFDELFVNGMTMPNGKRVPRFIRQARD